MLWFFQPFIKLFFSGPFFVIATMMKSSCLSAMGYMGHCCFKWCQMNLWIFFSAFAKVTMSFFAICFFTMCFLTLFAKLRMCCSCCKLTLLHNYLDFSCFENIMEDFPFQLVHLLSSLIVFAWSAKFWARHDAISQRLHFPDPALYWTLKAARYNLIDQLPCCSCA